MSTRNLDNRWFKEDRVVGDKDLTKQQTQDTDKALRNSTLIARRLTRIIEEMIDESNRADEDFSQPNWELHNVANISRRKTLREIIKLLP